MKMNIRNLFKSITLVEIVVAVIFVIYIVVPIPTPRVMAPYVESPLGMILIFCIIVSLFLFTHPIVAVLYLLVAYILLRRSAAPAPQSAYIQYTPTTIERAAEIKQETVQAEPIPPQQPLTLEEDVVNRMAPIGKSEMPVFTPATFKPVASNVNGASSI
jgi:hypothetical protein